MPQTHRFLGWALVLCSCGGTPGPLPDEGDDPSAEEVGQSTGGAGGSRSLRDAAGGGPGPSELRDAEAGREAGGASDAGDHAPDGGLDGGPTEEPDGSAQDGGDASTTAPGIGGQPSCAAGSALLCEDFEKAAVGATPAGWSRQGSAQVTDEERARGVRALRARTPQNVTYSVNRIARGLTIPGTHWGRVYYKVALPAPRPPSGVLHATFVALYGTMPGGGAAEWRVVDTVLAAFNNKHSYIWNVQPQNAREFAKGTGFNWSFDGKWHCVEWFVDEANQAFRLYLDGGDTPVLSFSNGAGNYNGSQIPKTFSGIRVGVTHYQNVRTGFVVTVDELAIDGKRVGCN